MDGGAVGRATSGAGANRAAGDARNAAALAATRSTLHRVATHVLARRRFEVTGRFGLRSSPGGIATPAFGEGPEVVRIAGGSLVHEVSGDATIVALEGATIAGLAALVGADLGAAFSAGPDTPGLGDPDEPLVVDRAALHRLAAWYALGAQLVDAALAGLDGSGDPAVVQLWPEHFDLGTHVAASPGGRVNLGASPGDGFCDEPYLYVGPWGDERPGDPAFWNAPFGAAATESALAATGDVGRAGREFLGRGLRVLAG
ncbi:MAG TPA: hypothetical protein VND23_03385 [Acidimicrobiales bacterium]|nr:hypothetical protein [Acidimicrobiales bacterium]